MSTLTSPVESSAARRAPRGPTKVFKGHTDTVMSVAYFPGGQHIASGSHDKTVIIWDLESGRQDGQPLQHDSSVEWIAISPDGRRIASGSQEGGLVMWDAPTRKVVREIKGGGVDRVAYSPDGRWIATASWENEGVVRLWDADTGRLEVLKCGGDVLCVAFSPDGSRIAVGLGDGFQVIDVATGKSVVGPIEGHTDWVKSVVYSPDGRLLVTGSHDNSIRVWDSKTGVEVGKPMLGHEDWVFCISVTADGRRIASAGGDYTVRVWDLETRLQVGDSFEADYLVQSVAFSPDDRHIISDNGDDVCLWDTGSLAIQGSSSPPTANKKNPPVRARARSVTSSILDLSAIPEPVVPHQDDSSSSESERSRGSSFDSILDLPAVGEPGKRRPKKKRPHRPAARIANDLPPPPVATTGPHAELAAGAVDPPHASKAATDALQAGPSAQTTTDADLNTPRSRQGAFARFMARFPVLFRRQRPRSPETYEMQPTTSNRPPSPRVPSIQPITRPPQRTPTVQTVDVAAGREMERMAVRTNNGEIGWLDYICFCVCCISDDRPDSDSDSDSES